MVTPRIHEAPFHPERFCGKSYRDFKEIHGIFRYRKFTPAISEPAIPEVTPVRVLYYSATF